MRRGRVYYKVGHVECQERISCGACHSRTTSVRSAFFTLTPPSKRFPALSSSPPVLQTSFDGLTRHSQGKVRDIYSFARRSDRPADRRDGSHLRVRLRTRARASPTRAKCSRSCRRSGSAKRATSCRTTCARRGRKTIRRGQAACRRTSRALDAGPADRAVPHRVRGPRLSLGVGLEGISAERIGVRHQAAGRDCANPIGSRSPSSRPPPKPRRATT